MLKNRILKPYIDKDYISQKRAWFIFRLNMSLIILMLISATYTIYFDYINPAIGKTISQQQIIFLLLFISYIASLFLLSKGYLHFTSNLLLISTLSAVWGIMFFDRIGGIFQVNTIVYIIAIMAMIPSVVDGYNKNRKKIILCYIFANLLILIIFCFFIKNKVSNSELLDYLGDSAVSIILVGVIAYRFYFIFYDFLKRTREEINERINIEEKLKKHQQNLEEKINEKTQDLQILNSELKTINKELSEKNNIINNKNEELNNTLDNLKSTQLKLIQNEKMVALGTLTLGVSHEINNPLNFIIGGLYGLENYFEEHGSNESDTTKELLGSIRLGVYKANNIVSSLNQFCRNDDKFSENCDIHSIIDHCLLMLQSRLKEKITVTKIYCKNAHIQGNIGKLHQSMLNILKNAIDSIEDTGSISITTEASKKHIVIKITDNGCGIPEEHINKIFDPFFTTKDPDKGSGLGLSIAYTIINEHKGEISLSSDINSGTTVIIKLPQNEEN